MTPLLRALPLHLATALVVLAASVPSDPTDLDIEPRPGGPGWLLIPVALLLVGGLGLFWHLVGRDDDERPPDDPGAPG